MTVRGDDYDKALDRATRHAREWLGDVGERPVKPPATPDELAKAFATPLQDGPIAPEDVVDELVDKAGSGIVATGSGRFYGWVIGGTLPAALAADWLVSTWDQPAGLRAAGPAVVAAEEAAGDWLLDLFGLPGTADVSFVTGATVANFSCLAAARTAQLHKVGWDVARDGLTGAPRVHVIVGEQAHDSVDVALRYLGLGLPTTVAADEQGRLRVDALRAALDSVPDGAPLIVCLQAGNVHSGAFDPMGEATDLVHEHGGWVHVDGAFGLWAAASPALRHLTAGMERADSWATDAHKTLNVPYDCGVAIVADRTALRAAMSVQGPYLILAGPDGPGDPLDKTPEMSRRARGVPVWAALRSLGRTGVADMIERFVRHAQAIRDGVLQIPGATVLNDVDYTQVCVAFEDDDRTRAVTQRVLADGTAWMSGSQWAGRAVLRISVSNWTTDEDDVQRSIDAIYRAAT
jgi:glutamate/tyrosine decarboxylase-like PLP-dependent enzyme